MVSLRSLIIPAALGLLAACSDNPIEPNTDIGLRVWAAVSPSSVSVRDTGAMLRVRVHIANPTTHEIRINTGGPPYVSAANPADSKGLFASYRFVEPGGVMRAGPASDWFGQSEYVFAPQHGKYVEAIVPLKSWIEDGLQPGLYTIRSWMNGREGASARFSVYP
jgi:hypothetical protein